MLIYSLREYMDIKILVTANFETPSSSLPSPPRKKPVGLLSTSEIRTQAY